MTASPHLIRWAGLLSITALALYLCWQIISPFAEVIILSISVATIFQPLHQWVRSKIRNTNLSALTTTLLAASALIVPVTLITVVVARELPGVYTGVKAAAQQLQEQADALSAKHQWIAELTGGGPDSGEWLKGDKIEDYLKKGSGTLLRSTFTFVGGVVSVLVSSAFLVFTLYYLFRDGAKFARKLPHFLPLPTPAARQLIDRTREVILACVYGVVTIAALQGLVGGLTFWMLGLSSPATWGVLMMIVATIPMGGAALVWGPAAVFLALQGDYTKAIILTFIGTLIIGLMDNFLRPKLVGERARLHELVIFFSVLGGLQYFGLLGLIMGPVVAAVTIGLLSAVRHASQESDGTPETPEPPPSAP